MGAFQSSSGGRKRRSSCSSPTPESYAETPFHRHLCAPAGLSSIQKRASGELETQGNLAVIFAGLADAQAAYASALEDAAVKLRREAVGGDHYSRHGDCGSEAEEEGGGDGGEEGDLGEEESHNRNNSNSDNSDNDNTNSDNTNPTNPTNPANPSNPTTPENPRPSRSHNDSNSNLFNSSFSSTHPPHPDSGYGPGAQDALLSVADLLGRVACHSRSVSSSLRADVVAELARACEYESRCYAAFESSLSSSFDEYEALEDSIKAARADISARPVSPGTLNSYDANVMRASALHAALTQEMSRFLGVAFQMHKLRSVRLEDALAAIVTLYAPTAAMAPPSPSPSLLAPHSSSAPTTATSSSVDNIHAASSSSGASPLVSPSSEKTSPPRTSTSSSAPSLLAAQAGPRATEKPFQFADNDLDVFVQQHAVDRVVLQPLIASPNFDSPKQAARSRKKRKRRRRHHRSSTRSRIQAGQSRSQGQGGEGGEGGEGASAGADANADATADTNADATADATADTTADATADADAGAGENRGAAGATDATQTNVAAEAKDASDAEGNATNAGRKPELEPLSIQQRRKALRNRKTPADDVRGYREVSRSLSNVFGSASNRFATLLRELGAGPAPSSPTDPLLAPVLDSSALDISTNGKDSDDESDSIDTKDDDGPSFASDSSSSDSFSSDSSSSSYYTETSTGLGGGPDPSTPGTAEPSEQSEHGSVSSPVSAKRTSYSNFLLDGL